MMNPIQKFESLPGKEKAALLLGLAAGGVVLYYLFKKGSPLPAQTPATVLASGTAAGLPIGSTAGGGSGGGSSGGDGTVGTTGSGSGSGTTTGTTGSGGFPGMTGTGGTPGTVGPGTGQGSGITSGVTPSYASATGGYVPPAPLPSTWVNGVVVPMSSVGAVVSYSGYETPAQMAAGGPGMSGSPVPVSSLFSGGYSPVTPPTAAWNPSSLAAFNSQYGTTGTGPSLASYMSNPSSVQAASLAQLQSSQGSASWGPATAIGSGAGSFLGAAALPGSTTPTAGGGASGSGGRTAILI